MKTNPHSLTLSLSVQHKSFYRKLARSLQLDTGTAEILSGEFAEEAILVKTDQLTRHEVRVCVCVHLCVHAYALHVSSSLVPHPHRRRHWLNDSLQSILSSGS